MNSRTLIWFLAGVLGLTASMWVFVVRRLRRWDSDVNAEVVKRAGGLQVSETRYRRLFEAAQDGILILDAKTGMIVDVNPFLVEMLGYSYEAMCGKRIWELGFLKDIIANQTRFLELQQKEFIRYDDLPLKTADGRRVDVEFVGNVYQVDHHPVIQCNIRDITARKQAQAAALHASQRIIEEIINAIPVSVFWKDKNLVYLGCNAAFARDAGFADPKDVIGKDDFQMGWRNQAELYRNDDRQVIESGCPKLLIEEPQTTPEGNAITLLTSKIPLRDSEGEICGVIGTYMDITDRRQAEEARTRLAVAVEQAAETILVTDLKGTILDVNPAFEKTTGYTRQEVLGQNPRILKSGKQDAAVYRAMWDTLLRGEVWSGSFVNKRKDGTVYEIEAVISPVRDPAGKIVNYVAVSRDVTHERQVERQFMQSQKMEAVGRLAAGVAHDFNNILTAIIGYSTLLRPVLPDNPEPQSYAREIEKASQRAAHLTQQLLAFSRKQIFQPKVLNLNAVITGLEKMLPRLIGEDVEVTAVLSPGLKYIKADPGQIEQVIMNLCVNARDAMPHGGKLRIATSNVTMDAGYADAHIEVAPGDYVLFAITDNGSGMTAEVQAHLFEPFFTTKEPDKGTGLGLATVFGIVKQSGGFINVYSEFGQGTTFKIYLPGSAESVKQGTAAETAEPFPRGTETILLVEDESAVRQMTGIILGNAGYQVLTAANGVEGLAVAAQHTGAEIALLMTDVVMPKMGGRELADQLQAIHPHLRVLYTSGYTADAIADHGVLASGIQFLQKPYSPAALTRKIREILGK